jgi:hypothetical protein
MMMVVVVVVGFPNDYAVETMRKILPPIRWY